ncbi:MAG TPA: ABC transporter permease [Chloroflexota bacterium]|jgi:peptide/nickel transport system permease protein|nr:ABC transporter permease [Chloroflexota bacterium]
MIAIVLKRLGMAVPALFGVSIVIFLLINVLPGDPLAGLLAPDATPADRAVLAKQLGLDEPLPVQYVHWLINVSQGNLGESFSRHRSVADLIKNAFTNTLILASAAAMVGLATGLLLGIVAALKAGSPADRFISAVSTMGLSVPSYWLAILLIIIFSATLKWLPSAGMHGIDGDTIDFLKHLVMPSIATSAVTVGMVAKTTRSSLIETFGDDFVLTLRAKGLGSGQILMHVIKNAAPAIMTMAGLQVGYLLGGSVLVETIFSWPGLGLLIFQSIQSRDLRVIQASVLVIAVTFVLVNLVVDLLQTLVNPRLRRAN